MFERFHTPDERLELERVDEADVNKLPPEATVEDLSTTDGTEELPAGQSPVVDLREILEDEGEPIEVVAEAPSASRRIRAPFTEEAAEAVTAEDSEVQQTAVMPVKATANDEVSEEPPEETASSQFPQKDAEMPAAEEEVELAAGGDGGGKPPTDKPPTGGEEEDGAPEQPGDGDELAEIFAEVKRSFVREMTDKALDAADDSETYDKQVVVDLIAAKATTDTDDEVNAFVERIVERVDTGEASEVTAWASAYGATGDETALSKARELAGVEQSEDGELQRVRPEEEPEREEALKIVRLAAEGDTEAMTLARETVAACSDRDTSMLSLSLYKAGDDASLDACLQKIDRDIPLERMDDHTIKTQRGLLRQAKLAVVERGDIEGGLKVRDAMVDDVDRAVLDAQLYGMGHEESRAKAYEAMETYRGLMPERVQKIDRELAKAGDAEAIARTRDRAEYTYRDLLSGGDDRQELLRDLCALHTAGDPDAALKIRAVLRDGSHHRGFWTEQLANDGSPELAAQILQDAAQGSEAAALTRQENRMLHGYRQAADPSNLANLHDLLEVELASSWPDLAKVARFIRAFAEQ